MTPRYPCVTLPATCACWSPKLMAELAGTDAAVVTTSTVGGNPSVLAEIAANPELPSTKLCAVAVPVLSVVATAPVSVPVPPASAKVTVTPTTALPLLSFTTTCGGTVVAAPLAAVRPDTQALVGVMVVGVPVAGPAGHPMTATGVPRRETALLSPTWPLAFAPQQYMEPLTTRAHLPRKLVAVSSVNTAPVISCGTNRFAPLMSPVPAAPRMFPPQQNTRPSIRSPHGLRLPMITSRKRSSASAIGVGTLRGWVVPSPLFPTCPEPQHNSAPVDATPQMFAVPPAICVKEIPPVTAVNVVRSVKVPSPTAPAPLSPRQYTDPAAVRPQRPVSHSAISAKLRPLLISGTGVS